MSEAKVIPIPVPGAPERPAERTTPKLKLNVTSRKGEVAVTEMQFEGCDLETAQQRLIESLGITEPDALFGLLSGLIIATQSAGGPCEQELDDALALAKGVKPADQIEAMLALQMAVTHRAFMLHAGRLNTYTTHKGIDQQERIVNKLARTFTTQMAALKNHRSPHGQQRVTVEHVTVNDGGQAIVGPVDRGPPGGMRK